MTQGGGQLALQHGRNVDHIGEPRDRSAKIPSLETAVRFQAFGQMLGVVQRELAGPEGFINRRRQADVILIVLAPHGVRIERHQSIRPPGPDLANHSLAQGDLAGVAQDIGGPAKVDDFSEAQQGRRLRGIPAHWRQSSPLRWARRSPTGHR